MDFWKEWLMSIMNLELVVFGKCEETILPEKDIDQSLNGKGAAAYKAVLDGETCTPYFEKRNIHFYVNVCVSESNVNSN